MVNQRRPLHVCLAVLLSVALSACGTVTQQRKGPWGDPQAFAPPAIPDAVLVAERSDDHSLSVSGMAVGQQVDLRLLVRDRTVAWVTAPVHGGRFKARIPAPERTASATLAAFDVQTGRLLIAVSLSAVQEADTLVSTRFRLRQPDMVGWDQLRIEGHTSATWFQAEVHGPSGLLLAREPVVVDPGGRFVKVIDVLGGVPAGSELRLLTVSSLGGPEDLDLAALL